ncbi:hypothetical protein QFC19_003457 [Naganishia cerealis]|uniref:Uncharacterized protein n=1 Tax=Naganishia cerealis TaxID=610337 RepID=A0ACC2W1V6_9TREE|nr:hypothetical protein QFC19_003457 [Naganishia cerealis]
MKTVRMFLAFFLHMLLVSALGMTIEPIRAGDTKKYSSKLQLSNCVAYDTVKNDVITVHVQAYDRVPAQQLNLHIFDSENNQLRLVKDINDEMDVIFTNLNSDLGRGKRSSFIDKLSHLGHADSEHAEEVLHSNEGKSRIYVCFDNIFADKSWSFHPQSRDIELQFEARSFASLKNTNYKLFTKYFQMLGSELGSNVIKDLDFEDLLVTLELQLQTVIENLDSSERTMQALLTQESKLRDANEQIFSNYTKVSIAFLIIIAIFGLLPIVYMRVYLKQNNIL